MKESTYKFDIFNESDIHCRECKYCGNRYGFEIYCDNSNSSRFGKVVQDWGYCKCIERADDNQRQYF